MIRSPSHTSAVLVRQAVAMLWLAALVATVDVCAHIAGFEALSLTGSALAQDADDDDDDDDDNDGDDDGDGDDAGAGAGGGGGGAGGGGVAAGGVGDDAADFDDGTETGASQPTNCFEEAMLQPPWLRDCEPPRAVRANPPRAARVKPPRAPAVNSARFTPGQFGADDVAQTEPSIDALPREIVILNIDDAQIEALLARGFVLLVRAPDPVFGGTLIRVQVPTDTSTSEGLALARQIAPAAISDFNHIYRPGQAACNSPTCIQRAAVGWPSDGRVCSLEAAIGMIDTRVNSANPVFTGQRIEILDGISAGRRPSAAEHGTAIAAMLVGSETSPVPGLLPRASLVAIEAFHTSDTGEDMADTFDIVRAIDTLQKRGLKAINLSFTGPDNEILEAVVRQATAAGSALVASAGNKGPRSAPLYPAAYEAAVAVTAISGDQRIYRQAIRGAHIDFAAPGVGVEVVVARASATRIETGTSFATPFITAAVAASLARDPSLQVSQIVARLQSKARDLGRPGRDTVFGWGLLQAGDVCP